MSDPNEMMEDQLIEAASVPSLATLYQRGKERGLIKPAQDYGHSNPTP